MLAECLKNMYTFGKIHATLAVLIFLATAFATKGEGFMLPEGLPCSTQANLVLMSTARCVLALLVSYTFRGTIFPASLRSRRVLSSSSVAFPYLDLCIDTAAFISSFCAPISLLRSITVFLFYGCPYAAGLCVLLIAHRRLDDVDLQQPSATKNNVISSSEEASPGYSFGITRSGSIFNRTIVDQRSPQQKGTRAAKTKASISTRSTSRVTPRSTSVSSGKK